MDGKDFATKGMPADKDRPAAFQKCGQSLFTGTNDHKVLSTDEASIAWYSNWKNYNFASGRANSNADKPSAYRFTQIVWKGANGKKVGFGVKGTKVVAWYCPTGNTPDQA
jgi:hypothetical protein